jgi:hypothetical protein
MYTSGLTAFPYHGGCVVPDTAVTDFAAAAEKYMPSLEGFYFEYIFNSACVQLPDLIPGV